MVMTVVAWAALAVGASPARAEMSLIRDAEIENTIHDLAAPLLRAADLDADALKVHLVKDHRLNAFVSSGMNLFLNTGLLMRAEDPAEVMGVMAHEFGHITGGHIILREQQMEATQRNIWLSYALGAAAALATGRGDAFGGVMMGTQSGLIENLMSFSRSEESQADQAGLEYLDEIGVSAAGLLRFMRILQGQELLVTARQDPYMRTHPLSRDRVAFIENHVKNSKIPENTLPAAWKDLYARVRAKLFGFLEPSARTLQRYPESDTSLPARYARAIAYYRMPDTGRAVQLIDALIAEEPANPYFRELKGQVLFEAGDADAAIPPYRESVRLLPHAAPLQLGLARALIARGGDADFKEAEKALEQALRDEPEGAFYWRQLAIARANLHEEGPAAYAMAEYALRVGRNAEAKFHAGKAVQLLPAGSPARLRAEDIKAEAERLLDLEKKDKSR
ncbi:putative Zn-dependent protease [uncultured Alphaproteobacteria bacterium]|uniref:Putative Zn-dependent protease n=1 Tax=uncultured Alphaproteobacteria bacterium TaxID=91750 RepID=A0A212JGI8_9PROT|nr:putative Zn-dependent protease [uncultured Alphaproteobacteria bacterium]